MRDSVIRSSVAEKKFEIETTTYGDYEFIVDVQVGDEVVRQEVLLSDLLKEAHAKMINSMVEKALKEIEEK